MVPHLFLVAASTLNVFINTSSHFFSQVCGDGSVLGSRFVMAGLGVGLCTLLCLPKRISMLKYSSSAAVCCLLFVYCIVQGTWIDEGMPIHKTVELAKGSILLLPCTGTIMCSLGCQSALIYIDQELTDRAKSRLPCVLCLSLCFVCAFIYATAGSTGYLLFGGEVSANVLIDLHASALTSAAQVLTAVFQLFKLPLLMYVIIDLTAGRLEIGKPVFEAYGPRAAFCAIALLAMSAVGMSINLRRIMAIIGGFTFLLLWITLPAIAELRYFRAESGRLAQRVLSISCVVIAPVFAVANLIVLTLHWDES